MASETAPREFTPPPIQAPSAKEKKYDRQLRLWAASGQRALEDSHVLLVVGEDTNGSNSSVAGAETLKNLILPGIGSFTIADAATVQDADLGINFFLEPESLKESRAKETARLLQELNPDVTGHSISEPLSEWLPRPDSLKPYNLIILCGPVAQDILQRFCNYASSASIPLIYIQSAGFYSSFSIQLPPEFPIVDTHPDPDSTQDLRLLKPWPELKQTVEKLGNIKDMSDHDHGHIPYLLLLLYYLEEWRSTHDGQLPSTFQDKTAFRELVSSHSRRDNPEGGEENFDEAAAAVLKSISDPPIGSGCKDMFKMESCEKVTASSPNFWLIANALRTFFNVHGELPLPGSVPDMKATSDGYIRLQNIYKSKARADVAEVTATVRELEDSLSRSSLVEVSEIESFCKNASHVRVLTNPSNLAVPSLRFMSKDVKTVASLRNAAEMDWENMLPIFVALNHEHLDAANLFEDEEKKEAIERCVAELMRAQGGEMHNISSVTGGMVAQEAIKLLTRQYVPVDSVSVFDGIRSKVQVFKI
ncbi:uncharacterized protein HMPREF1541_03816 [Cyphellophora europaea CBS 101466]|uniref:NEDD8-activating enzyme E1 regulatory subunit n=1 Tax=Cyphellophora europaea (strain CBS 101466) TaxID=1220924 RepID=W2RZN0_CYPE1|nr:uncharacterized protein HMPREF1541_03816 [Cyphellophora europaea CBS 101466]ETN41877.1 hypothetical protein HMPREF1541_03816 [Cyphellophora europaea CBS 101466]